MGGSSGPRQPALKLLREYGGAVFFAVILALIIRFFGVEVYRVPNAAMRPTLEAGDTIFVLKSSYGFRWPGAERFFAAARTPERGEVVIVSFPQDQGRDFVKRVIGLPGDRVEIRFAEERVPLLMDPDRSFYQVLQSKLKWGGN